MNNERFQKIEQDISEIRSSQKEIQLSQDAIMDTLKSIESNQENFRESLSTVINTQGDILQILAGQSEIINKVVNPL